MTTILYSKLLLLLVVLVQIVGLGIILAYFLFTDKEEDKSFLLYLGLGFTSPVYLLGLMMVAPIIFVDYDTLVEALSVIWQSFDSIRSENGLK